LTGSGAPHFPQQAGIHARFLIRAEADCEALNNSVAIFVQSAGTRPQKIHHSISF
jgi:hypothetical protein